MQHAAAENEAPTIPRFREEDIRRTYTVSTELEQLIAFFCLKK